MSDIKIFSLNGGVRELVPGAVALEKELQTLIEKNMPAFFGVNFLKSEFSRNTGTGVLFQKRRSDKLF